MNTNQSPKTQPQLRLFDILVGLFITVLILSQIMAQKLFLFNGIAFTTAIIVFPVSYIIGDVLTEVYGYARARRVIWLGFFATVLMVVFLEIAIQLPPAPNWQNQTAFETILAQVPRTVLASLLAYLGGEFVNSYVLAKLKVLTGGRHLWLRTIGSTVVGQAVDTTVFVVVAFWWILPEIVILEIIWSAYLFKVAYEAAATPLTYLVVGWVKKREGIDVFDKDTEFSPFKLGKAD